MEAPYADCYIFNSIWRLMDKRQGRISLLVEFRRHGRRAQIMDNLGFSRMDAALPP